MSCKYSQASEYHQECYIDLLLRRHIETPDHGHRKDQQYHIREQVGNGIAVIKCSLVDALLRDQLEPRARDGVTGKDLREGDGDHPS